MTADGPEAPEPPGEPPGSRGDRHRDPVRAVLLAVIVVCLALLLVLLLPGAVPADLRSRMGLGQRAAATTGSYAFLAHQPGDPTDPVTYSPCQPIHVELNPAGGPTDAVALVQQAMSRVSAATGLRLDYDGLSTARPEWKSAYLPALAQSDAPVLVSWATPEEVAELRGDVAGIGGSIWVREGIGQRRYVTGGVTLDTGAFAELAQRPDADAEEEAIILHEFGHLVGLAHVDDPGELMYQRNIGRTDFGPGDLAGLALLGQGSC
jgi:hypothetical protein